MNVCTCVEVKSSMCGCRWAAVSYKTVWVYSAVISVWMDVRLYVNGTTTYKAVETRRMAHSVGSTMTGSVFRQREGQQVGLFQVVWTEHPESWKEKVKEGGKKKVVRARPKLGGNVVQSYGNHSTSPSNALPNPLRFPHADFCYYCGPKLMNWLQLFQEIVLRV